MPTLRKRPDQLGTEVLNSATPMQPKDEENKSPTYPQDILSDLTKAGYSKLLQESTLKALLEDLIAKKEPETLPIKKHSSKQKKKVSRKTSKSSGSDRTPSTTTSSDSDTTPDVMPHPSDTTQQLSAINGMNGASAGGLNGSSSMPIHAGQQMDLNFIYSKVLELSEQLRINREQTQGLIAGAEELANRAAARGEAIDLHEANSQLTNARIADLTYKLSEAESINKILFREQRENGKLIGEYEQALEKVVAMLRDFAYNKEMEKSNLAKQYLHTLQAERDEHLKTRLERDAANTHILKLIGQMRHAYKLSMEESYPDIEIIAGLQNEVRSLRNALGLPKEKFEEETGYSVLKDVRGGAGEEDD